MGKLLQSTKQIQINKANAFMVGVVAAASLLVTFSLVASRSLLEQRSYQSRVINAKEEARNQLQENIETSERLVNSYEELTSRPDNVLGGNPDGNGDRDGDNGRIILNALPSRYDFPALTTSIEKMASLQSSRLVSVAGTDEELMHSGTEAATPEVVEIPFSAGAEGSFADLNGLFDIFELSIRPIHVDRLTLSGSDSDLSGTIEARTYYQPAKSLNIETRVVE